MISSQNSYTVRIPHFQSDQETHSLHRVVTSVDVVAHEQIVGIRDLASKSEELLEVVELTMDVTADGHWCFYGLYVLFL